MTAWMRVWMAVLLMSTLMLGSRGWAADLPRFDFTRPAEVAEWQATHDVSALQATPQGMEIPITGSDPYITGPARDYPEGQDLWMRLRLNSEQPGTGQVFYYATSPSETDSVHFAVRGGGWEEVKVPLPSLGKGYHLRFDPPGTGGKCVLASITFDPRTALQAPQWPRPEAVALRANWVSLRSGDLLLNHKRTQFGGYVLSVAGMRMASGFTQPRLGYLVNGEPHWLDLGDKARVKVSAERGRIRVDATASDADGADWRVRQEFRAARRAGGIDVRTEVSVSQDRSVVFLPMLVVFPGLGAFGPQKGQAVFAGLEYLDNEPSSSQADIVGQGSQRQVPDTVKVTFPLMAIQARDRYVGLIWDRQPHFSALFDSPDRTFKSAGHVMGVLFPGSDGVNRVEGSLLPYDGEILKAGQPLVLNATLIGGRGASVVPAIQQYVALRGLPPLPKSGKDAKDYAAYASGGWLDSKIREGDRYRHAYWPGSSFGPGPAADVPVFEEWLARRGVAAPLAARLREAAQAAIAGVEPAEYNNAGVSHVRYPVPALVYGHVREATDRALEGGRGLLSRFEPDGSVLYRKSPEGLDYGRTHFAPDANGLTAQVVASLLESALVSGDWELTREGVRVLRALDKFANTVPRGAQTWEVPLHTPDILASAHLVRAYTYGYELTGDTHFLDRARYWAWTGVPFVYLTNPTSQPVGPYATIAVLGATQWVAPNWMGMPVQWCGLVYSDALYRLARYDSSGPWRQIAEGITVSGIQQSWPATDTDLQALLPDSFNLRPQTRNPVAINPGTLQANAVRLYGGPELYDYRVFRQAGLVVHAPGAILQAKEQPDKVTFTVHGWLDRPYYVLVVGLKKAPRVLVEGKEVSLAEPHAYLEKEGRLILQVQGSPSIEVVP